MSKPDLHAAASAGTLGHLPRNILTVENLTAPNATGYTALHAAAKYGGLRDLPPEALTAELLTLKNAVGDRRAHV